MSKKSIIITVICIVAAILVTVVCVSIFKRLDNVETKKTVGTFSTYEIGKLDDETGRAYKKNQIEDVEDYDQWIHLKSYVNADGIKCEIAEKAKIAYQINFYDEDYQFISVMDLTSDYSGTANPEGAKYAIIEIKPLADPDGVVSNSEVSVYAKMLTVTYNK